jgi:hypothetical protein
MPVSSEFCGKRVSSPLLNPWPISVDFDKRACEFVHPDRGASRVAAEFAEERVGGFRATNSKKLCTARRF